MSYGGYPTRDGGDEIESEMSTTRRTRPEDRARYEYRVWGRHRRARALLEELADERSREQVDDCYLLVDEPGWNAKVRNNTLKIKHLIAEQQGFEQWTADQHRSAESTPSPFDDLFEVLRLDRPQRGKRYDFCEAVEQLDSVAGVRAVFVTKDRRHYRIGSVRAEATVIRLVDSGDRLRTISIEGDDLDELSTLRRRLGLRGETNIAVHDVLDAETAR